MVTLYHNNIGRTKECTYLLSLVLFPTTLNSWSTRKFGCSSAIFCHPMSFFLQLVSRNNLIRIIFFFQYNISNNLLVIFLNRSSAVKKWPPFLLSYDCWANGCCNLIDLTSGHRTHRYMYSLLQSNLHSKKYFYQKSQMLKIQPLLFFLDNIYYTFLFVLCGSIIKVVH